MEGRNRYHVDMKEPLIAQYQQSISALYLPLLGKKASSLYFLLVAECGSSNYSTIERLCVIGHYDINQLEKAIIKLEQFNLLQTYCRNDEEYLFLLNSPLSTREFFEHQIYARMYMKLVGNNEYELSKAIYFHPAENREEYVDVTHGFDNSILSQWNEYNERDYQKVKVDVQNYESVADFDYETFFRGVTPLKFPVALRTKENLEKVAQLATQYAIPAEYMRQLLLRTISRTSSSIDWNVVETKCLNEKHVETKPEDEGKNINPISFLYRLQGYMPVSPADKKLLISLQNDYKLSWELINYLVEYALENNDGKLIGNYLEKIAATWNRQKVDSIEKARESLKTSQTRSSSRRSRSFKADEMEVDEQDIAKLREKMFAREDQ